MRYPTFHSVLTCIIAVSLVVLSSEVLAQDTVMDSLVYDLQNAAPDKKIDAYQRIITTLWRNNPDSALAYSKDAIKFANESDDFRAIAIAYRMYGGSHFSLGNYDSALFYSKLAYKKSVLSGDSAVIASSLTTIGLDYLKMGSYPDALENLLNAYDIKVRAKQAYVGNTLNHIGLVYIKLKDYRKATEYLERAIASTERLHDNFSRVYASNNLGFTHLYSNNLEEARKQFTGSIVIAKKINHNGFYAVALSGLGQTYLQQGDLNQARKYFDEALRMTEKINDKVAISEAYYFISKTCLKKGQLDSAFYYVAKSRKFGQSTGSRERRLETFKLLEELYARVKKYDSAWYYKGRFSDLKDSVFNESMARSLANIELRINDAQTERALAAKDILIQQKNTQTKFLIFIIFIIIIFSVALFWLYRTQMKLSTVLTGKNKEISNQNEEIRQQKEELQSTNEKLGKAQEVIEEQNKSLAQYNQVLEKRVDERTQEVASLNKELESVSFELDNFIYKSSHDIRGPLVRLIGICNLALMEVNDKTSREYFTIFHGAVKHLCDLFDRLSLINYINSSEVQDSTIDFQKIVRNVTDRLKGAKNFEKVKIETNIDKQANIVSDSFLIETIFYNLIDNSIRFQNKCQVTEKRLRVAVSRQDHDIIISFADNGIGIPKENISHIFNMFSKAALDHQTIGLGLYTVRQCLQKLKGTISLVGNKENQTEFEVRLKAKAEIN